MKKERGCQSPSRVSVTFLAACLYLFFAVNVHAAMVSFCVIETGLEENGQENQFSVIWENAFLDVFFEAGHIVCNAPVLRLENKPADNILRNFNMQDVRNSGIDYLIIAMLDFNSAVSPEEVVIFIYKVTPREKILERLLPERQTRTGRDELEYVKSIARGFVTYIDG